jgi:hypothetical protein
MDYSSLRSGLFDLSYVTHVFFSCRYKNELKKIVNDLSNVPIGKVERLKDICILLAGKDWRRGS